MQKTPEFYIPFPLFDTHCHMLHVAERGLDIDRLLTEAVDKGLIGAMDVAVDENDFDQRRALARRHECLLLSAGIHPSSTLSESPAQWEKRFALIEEQSRMEEVKAVGESGLDFFRSHAPRRIQEEAFRHHLELACRIDKPIIIHNRDADSRIFAIICETECRRGVFHCFSSNWESAVKALDLGFFISFAGNLSYKKSIDIRDVAVKVPADRLLIETDSPYLSPQQVRGKTNHPGHIGFTLKTLAELRNCDMAELASQTAANGFTLY